jgi:hypothetical protein
MHLNRTVPANTLHARHSAPFHYCLSAGYAEGSTDTWTKACTESRISWHAPFLHAREQASGKSGRNEETGQPDVARSPTSWQRLVFEIALNIK